MTDELLVRTDTATLVVLDPACLDHRDADECDWWSDPAEELKEVRSGAALFFALGADGDYRVRVSLDGAPLAEAEVAARVQCVSGSLFVGPGEDTPGAGHYPGTGLGGAFFTVEPDAYLVSAGRPEGGVVDVSLVPVSGAATNNASTPLELLGSPR